VGRGFGVGHDRAGLTHHAVAGQVGAPAEIDIVPGERQQRVQAAEAVPHLPPHQHAGRAHGHHIMHPVVLALIDFFNP
jgi:hypothetical protein